MDAARVTGKYFEEFNIGDEYITPSRTITEADVVNFAGLSGDYNPLHMDEEFARRTIHKGRIAHGALLITVATGLLARLALWESTAVANLGYEWKFQRPVKMGDTIKVKLRIVEKKETQKGDTGIIQREMLILNQRDEVVVSGKSPFWVLRKAPAK